MKKLVFLILAFFTSTLFCYDIESNLQLGAEYDTNVNSKNGVETTLYETDSGQDSSAFKIVAAGRISMAFSGSLFFSYGFDLSLIPKQDLREYSSAFNDFEIAYEKSLSDLEITFGLGANHTADYFAISENEHIASYIFSDLFYYFTDMFSFYALVDASYFTPLSSSSMDGPGLLGEMGIYIYPFGTSDYFSISGGVRYLNLKEYEIEWASYMKDYPPAGNSERTHIEYYTVKGESFESYMRVKSKVSFNQFVFKAGMKYGYISSFDEEELNLLVMNEDTGVYGYMVPTYSGEPRLEQRLSFSSNIQYYFQFDFLFLEVSYNFIRKWSALSFELESIGFTTDRRWDDNQHVVSLTFNAEL